jgi:hypothetical protein
MLDTTIALTAFTRYRTIRIANIVSDTVAQVVADLTGDLNFDAPSGVAIAAGHWLIYKGATTYPSAISDPTNYPQGGAMYGKVTDSGGLFSDSSPGNQLLDG